MADDSLKTSIPDPVEKWRDNCRAVAHCAQLQAGMLYYTFEQAEPEAFTILEYVECIWFLVGQLSGTAGELEELMHEHIKPMRIKAGIVAGDLKRDIGQ